MKKILTIFLTLTCAMAFTQTSDSDAALQKKAVELAHRFIITDGHVDLPYRLHARNFQLTAAFIGIPVQTDDGDFDYVRAKKGGLSAPFMSIYTPSSYQETGGAKEFADSLIDMVQGIIAAHPDKFAAGLSPAQVKKNFKLGRISLPMGMENGAPIEDDLANVAYFQKRGIRYITLTHAKDNLICDSSYDTTHTWNGLSAFGRQVVLEMNKQGIMVDISHVTDSTFWQVAALSKAPFIASHSSCRAFTPGFERNMNDDMIVELGKKGGVIMITFGTSFLDGDLSKNRDEMREELRAMLKEKGLEEKDEAAKPLIAAFKEQYKKPLFADVKRVADHIGHVVQLAGIGHVGLGSDFDGVGDSLPVGLKDVSGYPNLIAELLKRGYSEKDIEKICYKNLFRVWTEVEKVSEKLKR
ncbi:MAG: dipeptidase [Saprospiraceae bacterium]